MKNIALILLTGLTFFAFNPIAAQGNQKPDFIAFEDFKKQALQPKEEVWVVDFWATWCRPCIAFIPELRDIHEHFESRGVRFVSISWDKSEAKWLNGLDHLDMPWQHLLGTKENRPWLDKYFSHSTIPTIFLIDQSGNVQLVKNKRKLKKKIYKAL